MLSCFKHGVADKIKQHYFNEIYSKLHILIGKRIVYFFSRIVRNHLKNKMLSLTGMAVPVRVDEDYLYVYLFL